MKALFTTCLAVAFVAGAGSGAEADDSCPTPTVNVLTHAEAAVTRPALSAPSEYPLSGLYSLVDQATRPLFTYAEAGPQYAGAFEALLPAGTPPPPRAVSAYPSEDIPDASDDTRGGSAHTEVTPISAAAGTGAARGVALGSATASSARSWATSRVDCDVVTVVAGWEANDVLLAPGLTAQQLGEEVVLVVGPDGSSADVHVTAVGIADNGVPVEGRPLEPLTDPFYDNGGQRIDAGEPRTDSSPTHASATGGSFYVRIADPSSGQGAGYALGGVQASIDLQASPLSGPAAGSDTEPATTTGPATSETPAAASPDTPARSSTSGTPPPPSPAALREVQTIARTTSVTDSLVVVHRSWWPLWALLAALLCGGGLLGSTHLSHDRFPTLAWLQRKAGRRLGRFADVYLRW